MTPVSSPAQSTSASMVSTREHLRRVDRQDWWRWVTVVLVTLLLTAGILALSLPVLRRDFAEQHALNISVTGLLGIVLLFDIFAVYQQTVITRLRRELVKQVAMSATLEMLRPPDPETAQGRNHKRKFSRFHFDQLVKVIYLEGGKQRSVVGRSSDLSEGGLGAVIPEPLEPGTELTVEVALGTPHADLVAAGVVRRRRGFHHCIEFLELTAEQAQQIRAACVGATPTLDVFEYR